MTESAVPNPYLPESADLSLSSSLAPRRVIFNFADRCNMRCTFCYVPFDRRVGTRDTATQVIDVLGDWKVESVTFGGGDPLMYDYLMDLIDQCRDGWAGEPFVQLDTNGLLLTDKLLRMVGLRVDLLGLPLDAVSERLARQFRRNARHPKIVRGLLPKVAAAGIRLKINTVVLQGNLGEIAAIGEIVNGSSAEIWSLYEYWPLPTSVTDCLLQAGQYEQIAAAMVPRFPRINIEIEPVATRWPGYFFVTQTGRCYTIDPNETGKYFELGNLLVDPQAVLGKWASVADPAANAERFRRRIHIKPGYTAGTI